MGAGGAYPADGSRAAQSKLPSPASNESKNVENTEKTYKYAKGKVTFTQQTPVQVSKCCPRCGREFWITRSVAQDYTHCSERCMKLARAENKKAREAALEAAMVLINHEANTAADSVPPLPVEAEPLTPEFADAMRGRISNIVVSQLEVADRVLRGTAAWNANQVNVFKTLINKVLPDLSAAITKVTKVEEPPPPPPPDDPPPPQALTREDLERLAAIQARSTLKETPPNADL